MKPKTKLQKEVVRLSATLPEIKEEDKAWAVDKCIDKYFTESRNRNYCLECGGKWEPKRIVKHTECPECNVKLQVNNYYEGKAVEYNYWAILDAVEGFQVVRMIRVNKFMKKNKPCKPSHVEVMQHWVRVSDGRVTTMSMLVQGQSGYYDAFVMGSALEVRKISGSYSSMMRYEMEPYRIAKGRTIHKDIRRNGYSGSFYGKAPHIFFSSIMNPKAETLLKAGQQSLFKKCLTTDGSIPKEIKDNWKSIKIAMRNNYIIENATDYLDYLGFLRFFDKDLNNPHYVCPDNFREEHDRWMEKRNKAREEQRLKEKEARMIKDQEEFEKAKSRFFDLEFNLKELGIVIVPLKSVAEFIEEGKKLHHCVGSYYDKENSLVLSARINGEPVESIEVNLTTLKINQARGLQNKASKYNKAIVKAVKQNMNQIAKLHQLGTKQKMVA